MAGLQIEIPPGAEPMTLQTVKNHLRVTISNDDDLIGIYAQAAREDVVDFTSRALVNTGYVESYDSFPYFTDSMLSQMAYPPAYYNLPRYSTTLWNYSQMIKLMMSPLVEVSKINYTDTNGNTQSIYPVLENWLPDEEYVLGDQIEDPNGNMQQITAVAEPEPASDEEQDLVSGSATPSWSMVTNGTTVDGPFTWTNMGPAPTSGFFFDRISEPPRLFPAPAGSFWPPVLYVPNAVRVHYVAGYGTDGKAVPAKAKVAILHLVSNWYENREPASSPELKKLPYHLERLLWGLRVLDFAATRG